MLESRFLDKFRKTALDSLNSDDSFLFLSGVEALATLALKDKKLLEHLMTKFRRSVSNPSLALKVGEILSRVCSQLGDMAPVYAKDIVPLLLSTASNPKLDSEIVASSISAAGNILPLTGFFLHDIQVKIIFEFIRFENLRIFKKLCSSRFYQKIFFSVLKSF